MGRVQKPVGSHGSPLRLQITLQVEWELQEGLSGEKPYLTYIFKGCLAARGVGRVGDQVDMLQVRLDQEGCSGGGNRWSACECTREPPGFADDWWRAERGWRVVVRFGT